MYKCWIQKQENRNFQAFNKLLEQKGLKTKNRTLIIIRSQIFEEENFKN